MEFIQKDIVSQRNLTSTSPTDNTSVGGGSGVNTNLGYLELIEQSVNLTDDGVILLPTSTGGVFGTVTGNTAVYLLHTGDNNEGFIFQNINSGITKNIAAIDDNGFLTIQGLNISNGNQSVNLNVDSNGFLSIDKTTYSTGDLISFASNPTNNINSGSTGGGLIEQVYSYFNLLNANDSTFNDSNLTSTFNAYTGYQLFKRIENVENISSTNTTNISNLQTIVDTLSADKFFKYVQNLPSAVWTITHNLYKYPSVTVVDSANTVCEGAINYVDLNDLTITFSSAFSGDCYLN